MRPLLVIALLFTLGCRTDREAPSTGGSCERLPVPAFPVGANVVDLPDDEDDDPANDGTRGYGSAAFVRTLHRLEALGLDGVVLPVALRAADRADDEVRPGGLLVGAGARRLAAAIQQAHARGLFVVLAPHLQLDDGEWRGEMAPADLERFFTTYGEAMRGLAELGEALCVEVLSAGVELKSLSKDPRADEGFTALVAGLREAFKGELTYSANWDEADSVRHWALFDRVGVNAFYPLASEPGASEAQLEAGARAVHEALLDLKERTGKPLWFTELGFKAVPETHLKPWEWPAEVRAHELALDEGSQARAYQAHASALRAVPAVDGAFFWVVPADLEDRGHPWRFEPAQGFSFLGKPAEAVVRQLAAQPPARPQGPSNGQVDR